jgi:hypothetical protein
MRGRPKLQRLFILSVVVVATVGAPSTAALAGPSPEAPAAGVTPDCGVADGVTVDATGDRRYRFKHTGGWYEEHVVPAAGFDPATAPAPRLAALGLAPRPAAGPDRALWDEAARNLVRPRTPRASCVLPGIRAASYSGNWSGYSAKAATGKTYSAASTAYTAPSFYTSTCTNESMVQFAAVANARGTMMVQAGMFVDQYSGDLYGGGFYEFVGGPWESEGVVSVGASVPYVAGHRYFFSMRYVDRYRWGVTVQDLDSLATYSTNIYHPEAGATNYIQSYGHFISERMSYPNSDPLQPNTHLLSQYMNHSDVRFRNATVHINGETDARLSIQQPDEFIMLGRDQQRLSNVDPLNVSTSSFTEHWARCGTVDVVPN